MFFKPSLALFATGLSLAAASSGSSSQPVSRVALDNGNVSEICDAACNTAKLALLAYCGDSALCQACVNGAAMVCPTACFHAFAGVQMCSSGVGDMKDDITLWAEHYFEGHCQTTKVSTAQALVVEAEDTPVEYKLNIEMDDTDGNIALGKDHWKVALIKTTGTAGANDAKPVIWVSDLPGSHTVVSWTESYFAISSATELKSGATITHFDQQQMLGEPSTTTWTDENGARHFTPATKGSAIGTYSVHNGFSTVQGIGLAQGVSVSTRSGNDPKPIVFTQVRNGVTIGFTPVVSLQIFMSQAAQEGTIIDGAEGDSLEVQFTPSSPEKTVCFDYVKTKFFDC